MTNLVGAAPRVLLATDGSEPARAAEAWIGRLRWSRVPVVDVVCCAGRGPTRLRWLDRPLSEPLRASLEQLRRDELLGAGQVANEAGERLQRLGLVAHAWAREGDTCETLVSTIEGDHPDLVVVGPAGRSGLATAILGSVTQRLVARATVPVLVARPAADDGSGLPRHVVLVVDGSPAAEGALEWLLGIGWLAGSRLTLLGVVGTRPGVAPGSPAADEVAGIVRADAVAMLERMAAPAGERASSVGLELRGGHPLQAVLDTAAELGADLVAVARSQPCPGADGLAERVTRHAPVSVLLVTAGE